jgi:flagellar assembly factor FliW
MSQINSRYFGKFDTREREVVNFPCGLPGFEEQTHYAALSIPGQEPILYLQSLTRAELCLITLPARVFRPDYELELNPEEREALGLPAGSNLRIGKDVACQVIVTVDQTREPSANLAAPLVINLANHLGMQVFQAGADYSFRHPLAEIPQLVKC